MLGIKCITLISAILVLSESIAIVEKQQKCSLGDTDCQKTMIANIIDDVADKGVPELDIPVIDPYAIKNLELAVLGLLKFTLVDGTAVGIKSCTVSDYKLDTQELKVTADFKCDNFKIEGHYTVETLPAFQALGADINIHGEGTGSVEIQKVHLQFEFPFEIKKLDDGELHVGIIANQTSHKFDVLDKVVFGGDNLYVGSVDISSVAIPIMNENWKFLTNTFGQSLMDKILDVFFAQIEKVFKGIPAKEIITDDLTQYLKS